MSGLLGAISKAVPYVSSGISAGDNKDHEPLLADGDPGYLGEDEGCQGRHRQPTDTPRSMRKSVSELGLRKRLRVQDAPAGSLQTAFCSSTSTIPSASLRPHWLRGRRSSSSSQVETIRRSRGLVSPEIVRHPATVTRLNKLNSSSASRSGQHLCESGTNSPDIQREGEETRTNFRWSLSVRPSSDPDLRKTSKIPNKPLKTCLKQKAKSANTTPPNGSMPAATNSFEGKKLRRMKTVDFEEATSIPVPSRLRISSKTMEFQRSRAERNSVKALLCPGTAGLARRSPASPAVTRTDVHVIAIAPALSKYGTLDPPPSELDNENDPATPTMQIVESSNGSYEVIWDDVPPEHGARTHRRSSSASQALEAISSTATRGLERVNTKLTEWSGTWNPSSDSFKPTIVVFPDDDGRPPYHESAIADDEDIVIFAPPNSERASATHSRHNSRPVSASMSRAASQDEFEAIAPLRDTSPGNSILPTERMLLVPDQDAWSAHLIAARRKLGAQSPERKLSNVDEADLKFRNHRDSVAVAHSRLVRAGGGRSELCAHSDSMLTTKKQMHVQNHVTSASRNKHRPESQSEPSPLHEDEAPRTLSLSVVAHAVEALKIGDPTSTLRPSGPLGLRSIRTEE